MLPQIQRWMQAVIMHEGGVEAGLASEAAREQLDVAPQDVEQVIARSRNLTSVERLSIYAGAYYARLLECLGDEFPVLKQTLGEETFGGFAFGYLQAYPSRSYTLGKLGANFARYLSETRPSEESPRVPLLACPAVEPASAEFTAGQASSGTHEAKPLAVDWPDFLIDLATLEWTFGQVFDGPGVEGKPLLNAAALAAIPPDRWAATRLQVVPCLRLVALRFPLNDFYTAARRGEEPPLPSPRESWLAVTRRNFIVRRHEISRPQYELLSAIAAGEPLEAAIERAAQSPGVDLAELPAALRRWFRDWAAAGFFAAVANE